MIRLDQQAIDMFCSLNGAITMHEPQPIFWVITTHEFGEFMIFFEQADVFLEWK